MDKLTLKYQIGLFGNFDNIQQTPETVKTLMEIVGKLDSYKLLLNTMTEITIDPIVGTPLQVNRISFDDKKNGLKIMFGSKRLDFIKELRDPSGDNMGEITDFTNEIQKIILELSNSFDDIKKFNRLSLITDCFINNISDSKKDIIYDRLLNKIFFSNQSIKEWNVRIVDKHDGENLQEQMNTIVSIDRIQGQLTINNNKNEIDDIKVLLDINTKAEDQSFRFDVESINSFLEDGICKNNIIFEDIEKKLLID